MSEWVGRRLSKVEIQKLLGRGGMADVYLGLHTTLNRPVAVKLLHAHLTENDSLLGRFRAEAQAVALMRHPHIVQVLDFDTTDQGQPYIVMELLEGLSLKDYMVEAWKRGKHLEPETIAFLIRSVGSALDYAHTRGIVHRDVKPANVMLRSDGPIDPLAPLPADIEVVLTDFGVAHMADAKVQTASGTLIGTPAYMSPEQVRGEGIDGRSDIYALGVMLYEMLTGQLPFDGDTQASILIKHISEAIPQISGISPEIQNVVNRALAKDADRRYQKAVELADALDAALLAAGSTLAQTRRAPARALDDSLATKQLHLTPPLEAPGPVSSVPPIGTVSANPRKFPILAVVGMLIVLVIVIGAAFSLMQPRASSPGDTPQLSSIVPTQPAIASSPAVVATDPAQTSDPVIGPVESSDPVGKAILRDSSVSIQFESIAAPPEGSVYQVWLTEPQSAPLNIGSMVVTGSNAALDYTDPAGRNLINEYSGIVVSIEAVSDTDPAISAEIMYTGQLPADQLNNLRLMFSVMRGLLLKDAVLEGISRQSKVYDAHLDNTIDAIAADKIPMAKSHAEHVINITVGRNSAEYFDYDGSGRPDNPGDGVGLNTYLTILQQSTASANADVANDFSRQAEEILLIITDGKNDALSVTAADTLEELDLLAEDMKGLHIVSLVDPLLEAAQTLDFEVGIDLVPVAH